MQPDFREIADSIGCVLRYVHEDDKIHRCPTREHPKKQNGSYRTDGMRGWVRNWESGETAIWHREDGASRSTGGPLPNLGARRQEEAKRARQAAELAAKRIKAARMAQHPYLARKGFPKALGLVEGDFLLVPAYVDRRIVSLQEIAEDGTKKNMPGGKMSGAHFSMGSGSLELLCEGYATGLSIKAALAALCTPGRVVCCFSASNVAEVAARRRRAMIIADHDRPLPQFGGLGAGEFYARKTGLPYAMPPEIGDDANDLGAKDVYILQDLLLDLIQRRRRQDA